MRNQPDPKKERAALESREAVLNDELHRAQVAENFMTDPLIMAAFEAARDKAVSEFRNAKPGDVPALERAQIRLHLLDDVTDEIFRHIRTGQLAAAEREDVRKRLSFLKGRISQFTRMDKDV